MSVCPETLACLTLCQGEGGITGFGDLDLKKGVDHDLKLEKGEVWNKI